MQRRFQVKARVAPQFQQPEPDGIYGGFAVGPLDAARGYATIHLSGYDVLPGGVHLTPTLRRFDAINHAINYGAVIYVEEIS